MDSSSEIDTINSLKDAENDSAQISEASQIPDLGVNSSDDTTAIHHGSLNTDDIVRDLVGSSSIDGVAKDDTAVFDASLHTDDIVRDLAENKTADTYDADERDEVLESMLESLSNDDLQDSVDIDASRTSEVDSSIIDSTHADGSSSKHANATIPKADRICQLPTGRVKSIIKADPDINIVSSDVTFLIAKSCELFLQWLGKEMYTHTVRQKKKTVQKRDLDFAINDSVALEFLEGALD